MERGWRLVSLYIEKYPTDPERPIYIDFAYYTGKRGKDGFGWEYTKVLKGHLSVDGFRRALRKHLTLEPAPR